MIYRKDDIPADLQGYFVRAEIGLEPTPAEYVEQMVAVFREVRRVLRDDGTLWLNLGDSYAANRAYQVPSTKGGPKHSGSQSAGGSGSTVPAGLKPKDLIGIPWRVAFALQADGWVLRQEIIWHKPNPMPESVTDRCTKAHEQLFLFAKAKWRGPQPGRFGHISDQDARWLALLIDAEGCIVVKRCKHAGRGDTFAPQVSIGNTSEALMREVVRIVGHGSLLERPGKNCRMLYWQLANGVARDLLHRLYPFFIVKHRQARICIHVDSLTYFRGGKTPERKQRSEAEMQVLVSLWSRNKECNSFGQPDLSDVPEPAIGRWVDCERYYWDAEAMQEQAVGANLHDLTGPGYAAPGQAPNTGNRSKRDSFKRGGSKRAEAIPGQTVGTHRPDRDESAYPLGARNKRSVWTVAPKPYKGAHFAVFPSALIEPCILAGSRFGDTVLDPFLGSGTTAEVAIRHGRHVIGCELNPEYRPLIDARIAAAEAEVLW